MVRKSDLDWGRAQTWTAEAAGGLRWHVVTDESGGKAVYLERPNTDELQTDELHDEGLVVTVGALERPDSIWTPEPKD